MKTESAMARAEALWEQLTAEERAMLYSVKQRIKGLPLAEQKAMWERIGRMCAVRLNAQIGANAALKKGGQQ